MKAQAIAELKTRLRLKFGETLEVTEVLEREITDFFGPRPTISVEDLDAFDNRLASILGFPARRRSQWTKLAKGLSSNQRYSNASQDFDKVPDPLPIKSRLATRSLDFKDKSKFPRVAEIVPVTRHWKAVSTVRDSPIFPKYENRPMYTPSPDRVNVTDTMKTTFMWKHGETEEKANRSQLPDEWGDITKWDTSKYLWERDDQKRALRAHKQEYREFLRQQMQLRAQQLEAEKAQLSKEKVVALEQVERDRALESQQARNHRHQHLQHQQVLQQLIAEKHNKRQLAKDEKIEERKRVQLKHEADLAAELDHLRERRMRNVSLTDQNVRTMAEQQEMKRLRKAESRMEEMRLADEAVRRTKEVEETRKQLSISLAKTTQEENLVAGQQRVAQTPSSVHTAHGELFRQHESRVKQARHQQLQNVSVLSQQVQEKTVKDEEWRQLHEEQAELWREEKERQAREDAEASIRKKQHKAKTKAELMKQMEEKNHNKVQERRLSPAEAKLNRHLLKAACGVEAL